MKTHQILLNQRPVGNPRRTDFIKVDTEVPDLSEGTVLVQISHISLDPAMRGWMDDRPSYLPPVKLGEVMRATGIGQVLKSRSRAFAVGDFVTGHLGVQTYATVSENALRKINPSLAPLDVQIGLLSTAGLTAYFGLNDIGKPVEGETVLVSGAAGAVGSTVGQLAKQKGCRVVGIAGSDQKVRHLLDNLHFDEAINYKSDDWRGQLRSACPNGVDVYFDNVGNPYLDEALVLANLKARIVLCGAIGQYNSTSPVDGPSKYIALISKRATMQGFIVFDFAAKYDDAIEEMAHMYSRGHLQYFKHELFGLSNFFDGLANMFAGENLGKTILNVRDE